MEITKYLCEFFFTDFWHWLGLTIMIGAFRFGSAIIDRSRKIISKHSDEEN